MDRARRLTGAMCGSVWATSLGPGAADGPRAGSRGARRPSEVWVDAGVAPGWACHGSAGPGSASQGDVWGRRRGASGWRLVRSCAAEERRRVSWPARWLRARGLVAPIDRRGEPGGTNIIGADRPGSPSALALGHGDPGRAAGPNVASASGGGFGGSLPQKEIGSSVCPCHTTRAAAAQWAAAILETSSGASRRGCFCHSRNSRTGGANQLRSGRGGTRVVSSKRRL